MVNMTISLPEETVRRLRRTVKERYGGRKGALSGLIREALEEHIGAMESRRPAAHFIAFDGKSQVAEAASLDELAKLLQQRGIDPRAVRMISSTPLRHVIRAGLRGKKI